MEKLAYYNKLKTNRAAADRTKKALGNATDFPYAYYYTSAQDYRHDILNIGVGKQTQCAVLEYFIAMGNLFLQKGTIAFFHSNSTLEKRLGFSSKTIRKVTDALVNKKILKKIKRGATEKVYFEVDFLILKARYKSFIQHEALEQKSGYLRYKKRIAFFDYMHKFKSMLIRESQVTINEDSNIDKSLKKLFQSILMRTTSTIFATFLNNDGVLNL
ncbi:hypothetical protein DNI29_19435 [Hymenobacter sediminis]|uniref:hypothetical protein n=1 Tax=Hymenobacter sediminis TaxID=2218621 RepID=UPI000DA6ACE2|nr:hypothetical protein [Hymenobacter sediminis]RPD44876.1 hypothetical protein DNI29_19435 [Hymenobacter sediminis]